MTLIEHCITDEKSYLAVLKALREQNHPTITAHIDLVAKVYQRFTCSGTLRNWMRNHSTYNSANRYYTIKIWPPELDPS